MDIMVIRRKKEKHFTDKRFGFRNKLKILIQWKICYYFKHYIYKEGKVLPEFVGARIAGDGK